MTYLYNLTELNGTISKAQYYFESLEDLCKAAKQLYKSYVGMAELTYHEPYCINPGLISLKLKGVDLEYNHNVSIQIFCHDSYTLWVSTSKIQ